MEWSIDAASLIANWRIRDLSANTQRDNLWQSNYLYEKWAMRIVVISCLLCLQFTLSAQSDLFLDAPLPIEYKTGFYSLMPDSTHEVRYLSNWKLKGKVKQVVIKEYDNIHNYPYELNKITETNWDTIGLAYFERGRESNWGYSYDTIRFKENGEIAYLTSANISDDDNPFSTKCQIVYNETGRVDKIIRTEIDTTVYLYDSLGRYVKSIKYMGEYIFPDYYYWVYPKPNTQEYNLQTPHQRYPTKIAEQQYNTQGKIVIHKSFRPFEYKVLKERGLNVSQDSFATTTLYQYDTSGRISSYTIISPSYQRTDLVNYEIQGSNDTIYTYVDTFIYSVDKFEQRYVYNNIGQIVETHSENIYGFDFSKTATGYWLPDEFDMPSGNITVYTYNAQGALSTITNYSIHSKTGEKQLINKWEYTYRYDKHGNPTYVFSKERKYKKLEWEDPVFPAEVVFIEYQYW